LRSWARSSASTSGKRVTSDKVTRGWSIFERDQALADLPLTRSANGRERLLLALAGLFVIVGAVTLSLAELDQWSPLHWSLVLVWIICFGAAHLVLCRCAPERDPFMLPLAGLLTGWGLLLIARLADVAFLLRQSIWLAISIAVFLFIASRPPGLRWLRRYRYTWLLGGLALLATTLVLGTNPSGYGPRLWLGGQVPLLGGIYIQPSEILKLLMVAYLASYLAERRQLVLDGPRIGWSFRNFKRTARLPSFPYLAPLLIMWGLSMVLLAWQEDLGAALLFFFTFLVMLYHASGRWGYIAVGILLFLAAAAGAYAFLDTVRLRVDIWLDPWSDPAGRAFQVVQSLIAVASGGLVGQGLAEGSPTYIPAIHTDFPFAAIAEEFGLAGLIGLIVAIAALSLRGIRIALRARSPFRRLLAAGLATLLGLQAWIIMGGNVKLIPLTGVTLPFVSYGGSSLLSSFVALALLALISRDVTGDERLNTIESMMSGAIRQVSMVLLVAFAVLALASGYWALYRRDALRARGDNPRLVQAEQQVRRGPILDRNRLPLAHSQPGVEGIQQRVYYTPTLPAVGYYSLKHGVGGIEASFDGQLRGLAGHSDTDQLLDDLLHRQPKGRGVKLTLDEALHERIVSMTGGGGDGAPDETRWRGAVVVMDVSTGEILALISQPTFDPNRLDADWEQLEADPGAPLLNRVTQGLYQPGGALQLVVVPAALEAGLATLDQQVKDPSEPVAVNGATVACAHEPKGKTLADAFAAACPGPTADLGESLGGERLERAIRLWGLDTPAVLEIPTEAGEAEVDDAGLAAIGQERLTVTPLHMVMVAAALGNGGVIPAPRLAAEIEGSDGKWGAVSQPSQPRQVISEELAERVLNQLEVSADEQVRGHASLALAGAERPSHVWYLGLAPASAPRYAVAVLVEHGGAESLERATQIGHAALLAALAPNP
jgi:cell division protein FtsW (lipid II flippase)/cell division protein FtsI/penicillin-binding protein 2